MPLTIPVLLFTIGTLFDGVLARTADLHRLELQRQHSQLRLEALQAQTVAARVGESSYPDLIEEFETIAGFRGRATGDGDASAQLAAFVGAVEDHFLQKSGFEEDLPLRFVSVSPGSEHSFPPFLAVEFDLNLKGRFHAIPGFLKRLSAISEEQACSVSVGVLRLSSGPKTWTTGELSITLPLRAYFRE